MAENTEKKEAPPARTKNPAQVIDAWYVEKFHNQNLPTEVQNLIRAAVDDLKKSLS